MTRKIRLSRVVLSFILALQLILAPTFLSAQNINPVPPTPKNHLSQELTNRSAQVGVSPFIGAIATGISLLVAYGPQIIAMTQTLVVIGMAVIQLANAAGGMADMVTQIAAKLRGVVGLTVGPLAGVTGVAKDQAGQVQKNLLKMTSTLTDAMEEKVDESGVTEPKVKDVLRETKKAEKKAQKLVTVIKEGEKVSARTEHVAFQAAKDFDGMAAKLAELQGLGAASTQMARGIGNSSALIKKDLVSARLSAMKTQTILSDIRTQCAGRPQNAPLTQAGLNPSTLLTQVNRAQQNMQRTAFSLESAQVQTGDLHIQIMENLNGLRSTLLSFADKNGVKLETVMARVNDPQFKKQALDKLNAAEAKDTTLQAHSKRLNANLARLEKKAISLAKKRAVDGPEKPKEQEKSEPNINLMDAESLQDYIDKVYEDKVSAYQSYLLIQSRNDLSEGEKKTAYRRYIKLQKKYDDLLIVQYNRFSR